MFSILEELKNKFKKGIKFIIYSVLLVLVLVVLVNLSDLNRESDIIIHVSNKDNLSTVSSNLQNQGVIKNTALFKGIILLFYSDRNISTGDYKISKNSSFFEIIWQLVKSNHKIDPLKITIREGLDNEKIADILDSKISNFNKDDFLNKTKDKQGYLFPDTYFFFPLSTNDEIIKKLSDNFENKIKKIEKEILLSGKNLEDIIIMASILEGEANGNKDNKIISGILWKRLNLGIPLQVDVDRTTYKNKGLPEKPLNNPGLNSIKAALDPQNSNYLYYLHDKKGDVHYGINYTDHKKNINIYLK